MRHEGCKASNTAEAQRRRRYRKHFAPNASGKWVRRDAWRGEDYTEDGGLVEHDGFEGVVAFEEFRRGAKGCGQGHYESVVRPSVPAEQLALAETGPEAAPEGAAARAAETAAEAAAETGAEAAAGPESASGDAPGAGAEAGAEAGAGPEGVSGDASGGAEGMAGGAAAEPSAEGDRHAHTEVRLSLEHSELLERIRDELDEAREESGKRACEMAAAKARETLSAVLQLRVAQIRELGQRAAVDLPRSSAKSALARELCQGFDNSRLLEWAQSTKREEASTKRRRMNGGAPAAARSASSSSSSSSSSGRSS